MLEEDATDTSHKVLIYAFPKVLANVKISPTDALKLPKFNWNSGSVQGLLAFQKRYGELVQVSMH